MDGPKEFFLVVVSAVALFWGAGATIVGIQWGMAEIEYRYSQSCRCGAACQCDGCGGK